MEIKSRGSLIKGITAEGLMQNSSAHLLVTYPSSHSASPLHPYPSLSTWDCRSLTLAKLQLSLQSQSSFLIPLMPSSSSSLAFVSNCPQIPGSFSQSYSPAAHILPQTFHINHPIGFLSHCSCLQHPTTKHCSLSLTETVIC